jgi:hypothetical protein
LKNPAAFHDDFWYKFVFVWNYITSLIFMATLHIIGGFKIKGIYLCSAIAPPNELEIHPMKGLALLVILSGVTNIFSKFRIILLKKVGLYQVYVL